MAKRTQISKICIGKFFTYYSHLYMRIHTVQVEVLLNPFHDIYHAVNVDTGTFTAFLGNTVVEEADAEIERN